jgi:Family of unknown function (DUF6049)
VRPGGAAAAAALALAATVLPTALLTAQQPAAASTLSASQGATAGQTSRASQTTGPAVTITGMSPQWASPGQTITVRGTVTSSSSVPISDPSVLLLSSSFALGSTTEIQEFAAHADVAAGLTLESGATWQDKTTLPPGQSLNWSIRLKASDVGMTAFGVYPLAAQLDEPGHVLATAQSYLPYEPAKKGAHSGTRPAQRQIAWAWPLIGEPVLGQPFQSNCTGPQADALAKSLSNGGSLASLVSAGAGGLAGRDKVTWTIDPALVLDAHALAGCTKSNPAAARAATAWLDDLQKAIKGQPVSYTPYADIDVAGLIQGDDADVNQAFHLGRSQADQILRVYPPDRQVTGIAWPAGGIPAGGLEGAVNVLAAIDGVSTLLLPGNSLPTAPRSVVRVPGPSNYIPVLLANQALTEALSPGGGAGSAFSAAQQFLAETAELAATKPVQPLIVAPPQRWQPSEMLATMLLQETAAAPWLRPTSLPTVAQVKDPPIVDPRQTATLSRPGKLTKQVHKQIEKIWSYQAVRNQALWYAVADLESSAWTGKDPGFRPADLRAVEKYVAGVSKPGEVKVVASNRDTLGGLKGYVPIDIYNKLDYAISVKLQVRSLSKNFTVQQYQQGPIVVAANSPQQVKLRVQASQVGSGKVTVSLTTVGNVPLAGSTATIAIQATQFGTLAVIILAVALGIFLLASAARALHRGRVKPTAEPNGAQPDNVVAERTGLDTAGKSRL